MFNRRIYEVEEIVAAVFVKVLILNITTLDFQLRNLRNSKMVIQYSRAL